MADKTSRVTSATGRSGTSAARLTATVAVLDHGVVVMEVECHDERGRAIGHR